MQHSLACPHPAAVHILEASDRGVTPMLHCAFLTRGVRASLPGNFKKIQLHLTRALPEHTFGSCR